MEIDAQPENVIFIEIKKEDPDGQDIKEEPPDEYYCHEPIENLTLKIEPYAEEENRPCLEERYYTSPQGPSSPLPNPSRRKRVKKKAQDDSDEDYIDKPSKKKGKKELVKKTYTTKAKRTENDYSEEITQHIQVINISEQERLAEFREAWHTRQHMRYKCELCAVGYVTHEPYAAHMQLHSPISGDHECDICQCRMQTAEILYRHRLRHYRRYRCSLCLSMHKEKETAASHVMSEHSGRSFVCTHCGKGFKRPAYLKNHIAQQHTKLEKHECPVCERIFHDKPSLRSHVRTHDEQARHPPAPTVICDICSRQFRGKARLRRHMRAHDAARALACACGARFKTRRGLQLHSQRTHGAPGPLELSPAACPLCARVCTNASLLRQHIRRMHSDRTKKYECDHCHRHYFSKGELRSHITWSHMRSVAAVHACHCGRVFRARPRLQHHIDMHHSNIVPERSHVCHCGKGFTSKQVLSRHMKSHEGLTYPCPECGIRFKSEPYVKVHHQLRHLNMTRAQIKALKQPRTLTYITGQKPMKQVNSAKVKSDKVKSKKKKVPAEVQNEAECDIRVPLFDFVELKKEILDSPQNDGDRCYE